MVSFRLSSEEYRRLREACELNGVRSVSELARTAMQHLVMFKNGTALPVDEQLRELRERVRILTGDIERLASQVDGSGRN